MNPSMQPAIQHLFQVSTLEDVPREELERLTREHPCFGYGHFLLSRKLRAENDDRFLSVTQKASLHFSNPLWLQWMLENAPESVRMRATRPDPTISEDAPTATETAPTSTEPTQNATELAATITEAAPTTNESAPTTTESVPTITEPAPTITLPAPTVSEEAPTASSFQISPEPLAVPEPAASGTEPEIHEAAPGRVDTTEVSGADIEGSHSTSGEKTAAWPEMESPQPPPAPVSTGHGETDPAWPKMDDPQASAAEILSDSIEKAKELRQSLLKINEDFVARTGHPIPTREPAREEAPQQEPIRDEEPPYVLDEADQPQREAASPESPTATHHADALDTPAAPESPNPIHHADAFDAPASPESPTATQHADSGDTLQETGGGQGPALPEGPAVQADNAPLFEPLHTIDYFASQGIRLTPEDNPTDQLGRQLKSFTEWLRMMRRLPQKDREIIPDRVAEEAVQDFAAHSIEGKEVVTETMAEVLAKQGMPERARLVYEKLSLLNPDKSAYFAAKIEQLNPH